MVVTKKKHLMKKQLLILLILFLSSCTDEDEKILLNISDIQLNDIGIVHCEFNFDAIPSENSIQKCMVRTGNVKKNDNIKYINGFIQGNKILIDIVSFPYDFDCNDDSCFTVHEVLFNLNNVNSTSYNIDVRVNFVSTGSFNFQFKPFPNY